MKRKTHKATAKKFKISGSGKVIQRHTGQNHFNAKESGNTKRKKRNDREIAKDYRKSVSKLLPNVKTAK